MYSRGPALWIGRLLVSHVRLPVGDRRCAIALASGWACGGTQPLLSPKPSAAWRDPGLVRCKGWIMILMAFAFVIGVIRFESTRRPDQRADAWRRAHSDFGWAGRAVEGVLRTRADAGQVLLRG